MIYIRGPLHDVELGHLRLDARGAASVNVRVASLKYGHVHDIHTVGTGPNGVALKLLEHDIGGE